MTPTHQDLRHQTVREGVRLGLTVAVVTWLWIALVDIATGAPLYTPSALGGVVAFTAVHFVLNVAYATLLVGMVHGAEREPNLISAALVGATMIEIGFIMLTAILSNFLGRSAWVTIVGGSILGVLVTLRILGRTHSLGELLHEAETAR